MVIGAAVTASTTFALLQRKDCVLGRSLAMRLSSPSRSALSMHHFVQMHNDTDADDEAEQLVTSTRPPMRRPLLAPFCDDVAGQLRTELVPRSELMHVRSHPAITRRSSCQPPADVSLLVCTARSNITALLGGVQAFFSCAGESRCQGRLAIIPLPASSFFHIKPPPSLVSATTVSQLVLAVCLLAQGYTLSILCLNSPGHPAGPFQFFHFVPV